MRLDDLTHWVEVRQTHGRVRLPRAVQEAAAGAWSVPEADLAALVLTSRVLPTPWLNPVLEDVDGARLTTPDVWFDDFGMAVMVHSREFHAGALQWDATVTDDSELSSYRIVVVGVTPEQLAKDPPSVLRRIENHYVTARRSGFQAGGGGDTETRVAAVRVGVDPGGALSSTCRWLNTWSNRLGNPGGCDRNRIGDLSGYPTRSRSSGAARLGSGRPGRRGLRSAIRGVSGRPSVE